jgi:exodeoxyribonuclease VII large subunit
MAASTLPIISAVGHETDFTICDFVADCRAPTPSAAAELAVPDGANLYRQMNNLQRHLESRLLSSIEAHRARLRFLSASRGLPRPSHTLEEKRMELDRISEKLDTLVLRTVETREQALVRIADRLHALNPLSVLSRGFCAVSRPNGTICIKASELSVGDRVTLRFSDNERHAIITEESTASAEE